MTGLKGKGSEINSEGRRKGVRQRKKRKRISEDRATCSQTVEIKGRRNSCSLTSDFCLTQMLVALTRFAIITSPRSIFFYIAANLFFVYMASVLFPGRISLLEREKLIYDINKSALKDHANDMDLNAVNCLTLL